MPQVNNLGSGGLNLDTPDILLPPNTFSDGLNIRFRNNSVETITGEILGRTLPSNVDFGVHWRRPDQGYNIFGKDGFFYRVDSAGNNSAMLNSSDTKYENSKWQSTYFNGGFAIVFNNGKSTPLYCLYGDLNASNQLQELPNWNYISGISVTAKVIKSLNYSLVAANLTINQDGTITNAPGTIRISVQAPTGGMPQVWAPGLTTDTADEFELSSTSPVLDMEELRGQLFVYSQDSISQLAIGTNTTVRPYSKTYGILNTGCVVEFDGNHFVVDNNDIYIHNGSGKIESIADQRVKDYFFNNINKLKTDLIHVTKDKYYNEILVCYPKGTSNKCNEALVYNYKNNTWSKRQLPNITYSFSGPENKDNLFFYPRNVIYMVLDDNQTLVTDDSYQMYNGNVLSGYTSFVEKQKLNTGDLKGNIHIVSVYPVIDNVSNDTSVSIYVKGQNTYNENVSYSSNDLFVFDPNLNTTRGYKIDPRVTGRLMNFKISSDNKWRLPMYDLDVKPIDRR